MYRVSQPSLYPSKPDMGSFSQSLGPSPDPPQHQTSGFMQHLLQTTLGCKIKMGQRSNSVDYVSFKGLTVTGP